jgi:hypothetical protein
VYGNFGGEERIGEEVLEGEVRMISESEHSMKMNGKDRKKRGK